MGLFSSSPKPPPVAQMPTCQARMFQKETEEMSQITRVANQLATETFQALGGARALESNKSLSSSQRDQVSDAKEVLKQYGKSANYTVEELRCFNRTYDRWGNELAQKQERQGGDSSALLSNNLQTKDGYTPGDVKINVDHHRALISDMAQKRVVEIANAIQTLNNVADSKGAPRVPDVSATWHKAANPATW